jgi:Uma2 family endonuclease
MASDTTFSGSRLVTADELLAMGTDFHGELIRGRLIEMAPAGWDHGSVAADALAIVHAFVKRHKLGRVFAAETGFVLERDPDTVRAPDVGFVRTERIPTSGSRRGFFDGPPDLAVEVMSPNDRPAEVEAKTRAWLDAGTVEVWIIDPSKQTVTLHAGDASPRTLGLPDAVNGSRVLAGFAEPVSTFFA